MQTNNSNVGKKHFIVGADHNKRRVYHLLTHAVSNPFDFFSSVEHESKKCESGFYWTAAKTDREAP